MSSTTVSPSEGAATFISAFLPNNIPALKLLKRSMYGRAKFDLLRGRVLYASAAGR